MTIDDYLEFVGREPMNVPGPKVLWTRRDWCRSDPTTPPPRPPPPGAVRCRAGPTTRWRTPVPGRDMQQVATTTVNQALETQQRAIGDDNAARALRLAGKQSDPFVLARSEPGTGASDEGHH